MRPIIVYTTLCYLVLLVLSVEAEFIPNKFDGFVYGNSKEFNPERILIEAFFDPVCPDSRDAWPPLKQLFQFYGSKLSLILHPFPLPYHDNAFITSRAIHIVNELNSSATFPLWESFFKHQEKFYNKETSKFTKDEIVDHLVDFVSASVNSRSTEIKSGFTDRNTDLKTRVSFKYGCSRGVYGTPAFFVNGFILPDVGSPVDYNTWRKIIDPLVGSTRENGFLYFS